MRCLFETEKFKIDYKESEADASSSWESHCHTQFEMIGVIEGHVHIMLEGKRYRVSAGQVTVIPPLCYHSTRANKTGKYRRVTALFDASAIPEEIIVYFADNTRVSTCFSAHIEKIKNICQSADPTYRALAEALMVQIIYEDMAAKQSGESIEADELLQKAISYIDRHLCDRILLDDLARVVSRSKSSFCHLFEEKMKISPKQYILQKKLAFANKLIQEGTPPTVAAIRIGYDNYSNFYRVYRKHYGISPSKIGRV